MSRHTPSCTTDALAPITPADYLKKVLTARVYDVAIESDLELAPHLSQRLHNKILLKREDQQPVFSFKLRGAYNKLAHLTPRATGQGRDLRLGWQPRPGRVAGRAQTGHAGRDCDAHHHAAAQN